MKLMRESEIERTLTAAGGSAAPNAADRARVTGRLRSALGAEVVDGARVLDATRGMAGGSVPPSLETSKVAPAIRAATRLPRLTALVSTGIVMGALGLLVGYTLGRRDAPIAAVSTSSTTPPPPALAPTAVAPPIASTGVAPLVLSPTAAPAGPGGVDARLPSAALDTPALAKGSDRPESDPAETTSRAPRSMPSHRSAAASSSIDPAPTRTSPRESLGFAAVVERLRKANQELNQGRAPLAMIQLAELDRLAGSILEEERAVTRILVLCALGEEAEARSAAQALGTAADGSIYAQRVADSCAGAR